MLNHSLRSSLAGILLMLPMIVAGVGCVSAEEVKRSIVNDSGFEADLKNKWKLEEIRSTASKAKETSDAAAGAVKDLPTKFEKVDSRLKDFGDELTAIRSSSEKLKQWESQYNSIIAKVSDAFVSVELFIKKQNDMEKEIKQRMGQIGKDLDSYRLGLKSNKDDVERHLDAVIENFAKAAAEMSNAMNSIKNEMSTLKSQSTTSYDSLLTSLSNINDAHDRVTDVFSTLHDDDPFLEFARIVQVKDPSGANVDGLRTKFESFAEGHMQPDEFRDLCRKSPWESSQVLLKSVVQGAFNAAKEANTESILLKRAKSAGVEFDWLIKEVFKTSNLSFGLSFEGNACPPASRAANARVIFRFVLAWENSGYKDANRWKSELEKLDARMAEELGISKTGQAGAANTPPKKQ
ncbi:MAG: hypothetical protein HY286_10195 [Planctomycetes bacterium]|nr:hypothetical protein [Planctomycetota bacterium]